MTYRWNLILPNWYYQTPDGVSKYPSVMEARKHAVPVASFGDDPTKIEVILPPGDPQVMLAEVATSDSFKTIQRAVFVDALPESDFTANALIDGLPAGQDMFYRIRFQDLSEPQFVLAWKLWQQQRSEQKSGQTRATALLKRMR